MEVGGELHTPGTLPLSKYPHHVWKEAGWLLEPVWEFRRTEKSLVPDRH